MRQIISAVKCRQMAGKSEALARSLSKRTRLLSSTGVLGLIIWLLGYFWFFQDSWQGRSTTVDGVIFFAGLTLLITSAVLYGLSLNTEASQETTQAPPTEA